MSTMMIHVWFTLIALSIYGHQVCEHIQLTTCSIFFTSCFYVFDIQMHQIKEWEVMHQIKEWEVSCLIFFLSLDPNATKISLFLEQRHTLSQLKHY